MSTRNDLPCYCRHPGSANWRDGDCPRHFDQRPLWEIVRDDTRDALRRLRRKAASS